MTALYNPEYSDQVVKLCRLGATDVEIRSFFRITIEEFNSWVEKNQEFRESLLAGREIADAEVANKFYQRACGYSHDDVHISAFQGEIIITPIVKHYPPDVNAGEFWLKNRRPDLWRDRVELTGKDGSELQKPDILEVARSISYLLVAAQHKQEEINSGNETVN